MKHKLIVTLVASALELYAATVAAQTNPASCFLAGTSKSANASTPVSAGPLNPVTGFPEYVTDSTGLAVQRCLDPAWCFFDPIVPNDPFSLQIGSGGEAFYWAADVILNNQAGAAVFKLVLAAETAFLGENPSTGGPLDGTQLPFLRLRYVFDAPADGTYTLSHPYGQEQFTVVGATGNRDIFTTYDRGLVANQAITGNVGPFMISEGFQDFVNSPAPGYLGNGGDLAVAARATGAPCFADGEGFNTVTLTGVATDGITPIDFGGGQTALTTDLFVVQGRVFDGRVQTPVNSSRLTYTRTAAAGGKIDAFATSTTDATVTIVDGPTIPVGSGRIANPVTLDHDNLTAADQTAATGVNSTTVGVTDASALPPVVTLTASDTVSTYVNAAGATVQKFDPTAKNATLVDFVDIAQADFDPSTNTLTVSALSGDQRLNPALTVRGLGAIDPATSQFTTTTAAPPAVIYVDSAAGGSSSAQVRVIAAVAPAAPSAPLVGATTAQTVALSWSDNASNETGFRIYTVVGETRTLVATAPVNATSVTISGLAVATSYTFVVEAFNGVGAASSETVTGSTLALPAAPATASFQASADVQRRLDVSWAASADATDYQVYRRIGTGAYVLLGTTASTSYADLNGTGNTAYTYQVVARRTIAGITDVAATPTTTTTITTVASPTSPLIGTATVSGNNVTVNWTDRSSNEWGYQVYRRLGTGAFVAVGPDQGATEGNAVLRNWTDSGLAGGTYNYRVDVRNWAGTVQSAVSANVTVATPVSLAAPTNLSTVLNSRPTVNWTDNSTGETGYRLVRRAQTISATTGQMTAGAGVNRSAAANAQTYREPNALNNNLTLSYEVMALNGTTLGPSASAFVLTSNLPTAARPGAAGNGAGSIRLNWVASTVVSVGGYEIQRCEVIAPATTCTNFAKLTGPAVFTNGTVDGRSTTAFIDTGLTSGRTYIYRSRTVGGAGTGFVAPTFSATRSFVAP